MRPYGIQVGNIKIVTLRVFCLPRWSFFLWHVTRSCSSRWRRGSSRRSRLGPGEGWESLSSRHSAAVWLWTRETLGLHEAARLPAAVALLSPKASSLAGWPGWLLSGWAWGLWPLGKRACLPNPSWEGVFGGPVFLLALLGYSVFQLLLGKRAKIWKL